MSTRSTLTLFAALALAVLSGGCASSPSASPPSSPAGSVTPPPTAGPAPSGFLGDSDLAPGPKGGPLMLFVREDNILGSYGRFIIDPVLIAFHRDARGTGIDPAELTMLAEFLREAASEQLLEAGYEIVSETGPGVARIRAAITDIEGVEPSKNLGLKAAGIATGVGLLMPSIDIGRAAIEVEILDSESGHRLVAVLDTAKGRRFFNVSKSARTYGDVKGAFKQWAKEFRQKLDRAHASMGEETP